MGFTPREIDTMTMWEFSACCEGYALSRGAKPKAPEISEADFEALCDMTEIFNKGGRYG